MPKCWAEDSNKHFCCFPSPCSQAPFLETIDIYDHVCRDCFYFILLEFRRHICLMIMMFTALVEEMEGDKSIFYGNEKINPNQKTKPSFAFVKEILLDIMH